MTRLDRKCSIDDCAGSVWAREMCRKHYARWREHGDARFTKFTQSPAGEPHRFLASIPVDGDGCLTWPYATNGSGYAQINIGQGRKSLVTRIICERVHGPAPSHTHMAAHSCGRGHMACVAPWHLSWRTPAENTADSIRHGTFRRGSAQPTSKLTEADVREIWSLLGSRTQQDIADRFGVSQRAISKIATGKTWAHLNGCAA